MKHLGICGIFLFLSLTAAYADPPPAGSEEAKIMKGYEQWINQQLTPDGQHFCCDISDGRPAKIRWMNGHWQAYITNSRWHEWHQEDGWYDIPDDLVTDEDNPTGWPILWVYNNQIRCFRKPSMS
jgi:hypothetical protein